MDLPLFIFKLLSVKGIGRVKANSILESLAIRYDINSLSETEILSKLSPEISNAYKNVSSKTYEEIEKAISLGVKFITILDNDYPKNLKALGTNKPTILSYLGNKNLLDSKKIGFCGSRKASEKGLNIAKDISQQISLLNVTVVSGYASGIDQQTHFWSLNERGNTIIVLPEGINHFKIKTFVKEVWDWNRVLVMSEFMPDSIWNAGKAMERNLTIVSLSDVMVLIEARETGGSIDAGYKALTLNKPLFAPVYEGMPEEASGNQILLTKGALPLKRKKETQKANLDYVFHVLNEIILIELKLTKDKPSQKINAHSILFKKIHFTKGSINQISFELSSVCPDPQNPSYTITTKQTFVPNSFVDLYKAPVNGFLHFSETNFLPYYRFDNYCDPIEVKALSLDNSDFELEISAIPEPILSET